MIKISIYSWADVFLMYFNCRFDVGMMHRITCIPANQSKNL